MRRCALMVGSVAMMVSSTLAAAQSDTVKEFLIDAPTLSRGLIQLTEQSGMQLIYPAGEEVTDLPLKPLIGKYTTEDALEQLLEGTGLEYELIDAQTISIIDPSHPTKTSAATEAGGKGLLIAQATNASDADESRNWSAGTAAQPTPAGSAAALPQADLAEPLEAVVVTGTNIRGVVPAGSPVIVIDRDEMQRSGYTTTEQVI